MTNVDAPCSERFGLLSVISVETEDEKNSMDALPLINFAAHHYLNSKSATNNDALVLEEEKKKEKKEKKQGKQKEIPPPPTSTSPQPESLQDLIREFNASKKEIEDLKNRDITTKKEIEDLKNRDIATQKKIKDLKDEIDQQAARIKKLENFKNGFLSTKTVLLLRQLFLNARSLILEKWRISNNISPEIESKFPKYQQKVSTIKIKTNS